MRWVRDQYKQIGVNMQEIPETATMYSHLSECFLRWNDGELEVYCKYAKVWKPSVIRNLELAKVVKL